MKDAFKGTKILEKPQTLCSVGAGLADLPPAQDSTSISGRGHQARSGWAVVLRLASSSELQRQRGRDNARPTLLQLWTSPALFWSFIAVTPFGAVFCRPPGKPQCWRGVCYILLLCHHHRHRCPGLSELGTLVQKLFPSYKHMRFPHPCQKMPCGRCWPARAGEPSAAPRCGLSPQLEPRTAKRCPQLESWPGLHTLGARPL